MPDSAEIESLVIKSVQMLAKDFEIDALTEPTTDSLLYGEGGPLDSMALVNLVADIEDALSEEYSVSVSLTDEKALSAKRSPFRSVGNLRDAIAERLAQ